MKRTLSEVLEIYDVYKSGKTIKEVSELYKTDCKYLFKKHSLETENAGDRRLYYRSLKNEFKYTFESISNEKEAYIIGLLFADGTTGLSQTSLKLQACDLEILEKIRDYIKPDQEIYKEKNSYILRFSSIEITNNIKNLGIIKDRKSLNINLPFVEENLYRHLLRGYFDGDGTVYLDGNYLRCNICSISLNFLEDINKNLEKLNCVKGTINKENRVGKIYNFNNYSSIATKDMYRLKFNNKLQIESFYDFLYKDSVLFMKRKKDKFDNNVNTELISSITKGDETV